MNKEEERYVFITKYALTKGILKIYCVIDNEYQLCREVPTNIIGYYASKGEFFLTEEEAIKKAEEMRDKKLVSLKKQMDKLKNMKFKTTTIKRRN